MSCYPVDGHLAAALADLQLRFACRFDRVSTRALVGLLGDGAAGGLDLDIGVGLLHALGVLLQCVEVCIVYPIARAPVPISPGDLSECLHPQPVGLL